MWMLAEEELEGLFTKWNNNNGGVVASAARREVKPPPSPSSKLLLQNGGHGGAGSGLHGTGGGSSFPGLFGGQTALAPLPTALDAIQEDEDDYGSDSDGENDHPGRGKELLESFKLAMPSPHQQPQQPKPLTPQQQMQRLIEQEHEQQRQQQQQQQQQTQNQQKHQQPPPPPPPQQQPQSAQQPPQPPQKQQLTPMQQLLTQEKHHQEQQEKQKLHLEEEQKQQQQKSQIHSSGLRNPLHREYEVEIPAGVVPGQQFRVQVSNETVMRLSCDCHATVVRL
jgi:hypothetical protein